MSVGYCVLIRGEHTEDVTTYGPLDQDEANALADRIREGAFADIDRVDVLPLEGAPPLTEL